MQPLARPNHCEQVRQLPPLGLLRRGSTRILSARSAPSSGAKSFNNIDHGLTADEWKEGLAKASIEIDSNRELESVFASLKARRAHRIELLDRSRAIYRCQPDAVAVLARPHVRGRVLLARVVV